MINGVKGYYIHYHDRILNKPYHSLYWIRRYAHRQIHAQFLRYLKPGQLVLDAGCGEGVLSCLMAQQRIEVVGIDISASNIDGARRLAKERGVGMILSQSDVEHLPFPDDSFEVVLSSHVLEHLPSLLHGLRELYRVTRSLALIAMPTCLNPACWVLLGSANYWKLSRRSLVALPIGLTKTAMSFMRGGEGPNEGYGGNKDVPHVWRFPWVMRQQIESVGFRITRFEAGPLILPYLAQYIPAFRSLHRYLDKFRGLPCIRELGYGGLAVCEKV